MKIAVSGDGALMNRKLVVAALVGAATAVAQTIVAPTARADYLVRACAGTFQLGGWKTWPPLPQNVGFWDNGLRADGCGSGNYMQLRVAVLQSLFAPLGSSGGWRFEAPEGTVISGVSAETDAWIQQSELRPGFWVPTTGQTLLGESAFPNRSGNNVGVASLSVKDLAFGLTCQLTRGCSASYATVGVSNIAVSLNDQVSPAISTVQGPPDQWVSGGVVPLRFNARDNIGIQTLALSSGGRDIAESSVPCYNATNNVEVRPCAEANQAVTADVPVASLPDGENLITATAIDVGGRETAHLARIRVDRVAPSPPRRLSADGGDRWRNENRVRVSWANPPESGAPIAGAHYEFCPASSGPYDARGCVASAGSQDQSDILAAPHDGEWSLRVAVRDAAGNSDPSQAAVIEPLRVDTRAPHGTFEAFNADDPLRVLLTAEDALSGVAGVEIEMRREGESTWRALPVEGSNGHYSAVTDDTQHPSGNYSVRARVTDRAGNERTITTLRSGAVLSIGLPLRSASEMLVGKPSRKLVKSARGARPRYKRVLVERPTAAFGTSVSLSGKLTDQAGNPRADAAIDVFERVDLPGRDWLYVTTVNTGTSGSFTYKAKPGPARRLRFSYRGSPRTQPWAKEVELRVRAAITIRPDQRRARNGGVVTFSGRLLSGPVPKGGKVLALQALTARGWRTFATPRARAADGRWRFPYRFTGTNVRARYTFRVVALSEAGYPYAQGRSKTTHVVVDP